MTKKFFIFSCLSIVLFSITSSFTLFDINSSTDEDKAELKIYQNKETKQISDIKSFDSNAYYNFKISDSTYYFKIDSINDSFAYGSFFVDTKRVSTSLENFSIEKKKGNKYELSIREQNHKIKLEFSSQEQEISFRYATRKRFLLIFSKYSSFSSPIVINKQEIFKFVETDNRFKDKVFEDFIIFEDITYGNALAYWDSFVTNNESNYAKIIMKGLKGSAKKKNIDLKMDIYLPLGDSIKKRPLMMYIHGGGFYIGDKKDKTMVESCKYFAQLGYVAASINYRMGFQPIGSSVERAGYRAVQDAHAAMRFLVDKAETYGIDTSLLFVGGSSAGGITSLNLAYMQDKDRVKSSKSSLLHKDLGGISESTNDIQTKFSIKSVVNMWGAINDINLLKNSKVPIISFHGNADDVVPITHDYPYKDIKFGLSSLFLDKMYGSDPIHKMAEELGIDQELHIFDNHGHSLNVDENEDINDNFYIINDRTKDFLYKRIFPDDFNIKPIIRIGEKFSNMYYTNCKDFKDIRWSIEGGMILKTVNNVVNVIWFENETNKKLKMSILLKNGLRYNDTYEF